MQPVIDMIQEVHALLWTPRDITINEFSAIVWAFGYTPATVPWMSSEMTADGAAATVFNISLSEARRRNCRLSEVYRCADFAWRVVYLGKKQAAPYFIDEV